MKKVSRRALFALALALVLLGGASLFTLQYFARGSQWVTFSGSPHVYENGVLQTGTVLDSDGEVLLTLTGTRTYSRDPILRESFLHILGDPTGNVPDPILEQYSAYLAGYSPINGIYFAENTAKDLELTLNSQVQKTAYQALAGRKGTVAVYNYVNGEIICAASSPSYDPYNIPEITEDPTGKFDGIYVNRFTDSVYVPGSIFKLVTAACALDTMDESLLTRTFQCDGTLEVGDEVVVCNGIHGEITLKEALAKSCNCAFGSLSLELGADALEDYVNQMGLLKTYSSDGLQTKAGRFDLTDVAPVDLAWSGIGQHDVMINPYSFLRFVGAIAGNGTAAEPYFVSKCGDYQAKNRSFHLDISEKTTGVLKEYMANNVRTVYGADLFPNVTVCAKSGTAEVGEGQTPHATFAGFVDDPRYPLAFIVVVENGGSGSAVCSSIAGNVLSECVKTMGTGIS